MAREESITFSGDGVTLEGRLALPVGATHAAVICHPHPQYGGDMDNSVVRTLAAHLQREGIATLRFNFRGTGGSSGAYANGVGEARDAHAAVAVLRERSSAAQAALAGYSFGAMVALQAGHADAGVDRLIAIAPPLPMFDVTFLQPCAKTKLFLLGDHDQYCPFASLERVVATLAGANAVHRLAGADHFLAGMEDEIGRVVAEFVRRGDR
jgi:alpha/beta superfamily hydrolase